MSEFNKTVESAEPASTEWESLAIHNEDIGKGEDDPLEDPTPPAVEEETNSTVKKEALPHMAHDNMDRIEVGIGMASMINDPMQINHLNTLGRNIMSEYIEHSDPKVSARANELMNKLDSAVLSKGGSKSPSEALADVMKTLK